MTFEMLSFFRRSLLVSIIFIKLKKRKRFISTRCFRTDFEVRLKPVFFSCGYNLNVKTLLENDF